MVTSPFSINTLSLISVQRDPFITSIDKQITVVKGCAYAQGTIKNRWSQIKAYLLFALYSNFQILPTTAINLQRYMVFLSRSFQSFQTLRNYIDGLRFYHLMFGFEFGVVFDDFQVQLVLKGLRRNMLCSVSKKTSYNIRRTIKDTFMSRFNIQQSAYHNLGRLSSRLFRVFTQV